MIDYLNGITQNIVADVLVAAFLTFVWVRAARWWKKSDRRFDSRTWFATVELWFARSLALACAVGALQIQSFEWFLAGLAIGVVLTVGLMFGAVYLACWLLNLRMSPYAAMRITYWAYLVTSSLCWLLDPHLVVLDEVPMDRAIAYGLIAAAVALLGVQSVPRFVAARWRLLGPVDRRVATVVSGLTIFVVVLLRHSVTWLEVAAFLPAIMFYVTFIALVMFHMTIEAARALIRWADVAIGSSDFAPEANAEAEADSAEDGSPSAWS